MRSLHYCEHGHAMNRIYRRDFNRNFVAMGYVCPQCGAILIQDPELPMCNILECGDLVSKEKYDSWGIPL